MRLVAGRLPGLRAREGDLWAQGMKDAAAEIREQRAQVEGELSDWALRIDATQAAVDAAVQARREFVEAGGNDSLLDATPDLEAATQRLRDAVAEISSAYAAFQQVSQR